jgi:hypothetical protein
VAIDDGKTYVMPPSQAVLRDLSGLPDDIQRSTEAATALALAMELERGRAQSSAAVAKELVALMQMLRAQANTANPEEDPLEKLATVRKLRLAEGSAS